MASTQLIRPPHGATAFGPCTTVFQTASVQVDTPHLYCTAGSVGSAVGLTVGRTVGFGDGVPRSRGVGAGTVVVPSKLAATKGWSEG